MTRSFLFAALAGFGMAGQAWGQCAATIEGNDQLQYNQKELHFKQSCKEVTITLKHVGQLAANVMGHNWVLTKTPDFQAVAQAGQGAGPPNFLPAGDARVLASTAVIGGGQSVSVKVDVTKLVAGGDYTFFCSFPGHFVLMNGKFVIE